MESPKKAPKRLGDVLAEVLKNAGISGKNDLRALSEAWCQAAGPEIARRSRVAGLHQGTLTVTVESAALYQEIEGFLKGEILAKMKTAFPVKKIVHLRCVLKGNSP